MGHPVETHLGLKSLLGDGGELVEGLDVLVGHLSEDLAVELDAGELQAVHELGVGDVVHAGGGVDTGNPEAADLTLLVAAIAVLVLEGSAAPAPWRTYRNGMPDRNNPLRG